MEDLLLATAGEDVRLWSMPELKLHSVKNGANANVTCCTCSNNGEMVAYTHEGHGINIAFLRGDEPTVTLPTTFEQSNVSFSTNSKYLVSGGNDCVVNVWDIKSRSVKRAYTDHTKPISFCIFNFNGNVIASASTEGEIILTEVQSGSPCQPMIGNDAKGLSCMAYSHFTRYLLASSSASGALALWDTKESKLVKSFMEHSAPATCLSFSPLNDMLLCSTGLDKKMIFYDVCYKKIVKTINTDGPLTSCEFMHDGTTVAVGSASGHVSVFDLRHGSLPLTVVQGHKTSVRSVSFQKIPKDRPPIKRSTEERVVVSSSVPNSPKIHMVKSPTDINFNKPTNENHQSKMAIKIKRASSFDVLGKAEPTVSHPNNEVKNNTPTNIPKSPPPVHEEKVRASIPIDSTTPARKAMKREKSDLTKHDLKEEGTPSRPRRPSFERSRSGLSRFLLMARSSEDVSHMMTNKKKERSTDDLFKIKKNKDNEPVDGKKGLLGIKSPFKKKTMDAGKRSDESETSSIDSLSIEDKGNYADRRNRNSNRSNESDSRSMISNRSKSEMAPSPLLSPMINIIDQTRVIKKEIENSLPVNNSDEAQSPMVCSADNTNQYDEVFQYDVPTNNISEQFIERMITEAMEENRIAIHNDMINLQVEFIRQMEIQKNQIEQMLEHYSVKEDLVKEILSLRAENNRLVTKY